MFSHSLTAVKTIFSTRILFFSDAGHRVKSPVETEVSHPPAWRIYAKCGFALSNSTRSTRGSLLIRLWRRIASHACKCFIKAATCAQAITEWTWSSGDLCCCLPVALVDSAFLPLRVPIAHEKPQLNEQISSQILNQMLKTTQARTCQGIAHKGLVRGGAEQRLYHACKASGKNLIPLLFPQYLVRNMSFAVLHKV